MSASPDLIAHCSELLSSMGSVRTTRMFGGCGLYVDDIFLALIFGDTLYLKADEQSRDTFAKAGGAPFEYTAKGETRSISYWSAPAEAMESPALMRPWADLALAAALRKRSAPKKAKPKAKAPTQR